MIKMKALVLLSGGLDSRLAIKLMLDQGIKVEAVHFKIPFEGCCLPDCSFKFAQIEGIKLHIIDATKGKEFNEYINLVKKPKHGYGTATNPCIDCRIFMLKKAKQLAKKIKAKFIVTGEVLNERPMSQRRKIFELMEKVTRLKGKILRPLSAKLLPETEAEKKGWVDRSKLLEIIGRRRTPQLNLAKKYKLRDFPMPGGGCILCEKEFTNKLQDLLDNKKKIMPKDIQLLRLGRHFRFNNNKIIVGRNEVENNMLLKLKDKSDYAFEVVDIPGPTTLLQGKKTQEAIEFAAKLTAKYSKAKTRNVNVKYGRRKILITQATKKQIEKYRL